MSTVRFHDEGLIETDAEFIEGYTDALSFPGGTGSTITVTSNASLKPAEITVEFWFRMRNAISARKFFLTKWNGYSCELDASGRPFFRVSKTGPTDSPLGSPIIPGEWYHFAGTYSPSTGNRLYINGSLIGNTAADSNVLNHSDSALTIGNYSSGVLDGDMRDIRVWNTVRTQTEISENMGSDMVGSLNLVAYWKCNDTYSANLTDYSGNGHTGVINPANVTRINTQPLTTKDGLFAIKGEIIEDREDKLRLYGVPGDSKYIQVPSTTLRAVEFWMTLDLVQNSAAYLIDARNGAGTGGYIYTGGTGSSWVKMYVNGVSTTVGLASIPKGELIHVYIEANVNLTDDVTIFARHSLAECLQGSINSLRFYDRSLTENEILQGYAKNPTRDGLVGEWLMRNFKGGKAIDSSGKGLDASVINGETGYSFTPSGDLLLTGAISDKSTNGLHFAGSNDRLEFPIGSGYDVGNNDMSIYLWVKPETVAGSEMFLSAGTATGNRRLYAGLYAGKWDIGIESSAWGTGTIVAPVGEWSHISITFNSSTNIATMYVNGEISVEKPYADYTLMDNFRLGIYGDLSYDFNGSVTDFSVWSYLKTHEEVRSEMSKKFTGEENNLIGYWPFDDKSGTVVNDRSPNNYHANIYGATRIFE